MPALTLKLWKAEQAALREKLAKEREARLGSTPSGRALSEPKAIPADKVDKWRAANRARGAQFLAAWTAATDDDLEAEIAERRAYLEAHAPCALSVYEDALAYPENQVQYCIQKGYVEGKDYVKLPDPTDADYKKLVYFNAFKASGRMLGHARSRAR